ncbi:hypothetical protein I3760_04G152300 [Carya illinoinensis]|nr:hypothetical protein I3760_04G152300 [Carya illinoinensis]
MNLDLVEDIKDKADVKMMTDKRKSKRYFNQRVRPQSFKKGDLVLREIEVTTQEEEKLGPKWEGKYVVTTCRRLGVCWLKDAKGKELPHLWNSGHLKNIMHKDYVRGEYTPQIDLQ